MKISPFCLHLFFAIGVVQGVENQLVAVKVKVNAGFAFTLNRLIYSLLRGKVKGEGKNGKFAESAGAYIRVGACPARRIEWDFVRGREVFERNKGGSREKWRSFERKSACIFRVEWGRGRRNAYFLFFLARKSRISGALVEKTPRQTDFFGAK